MTPIRYFKECPHCKHRNEYPTKVGGGGIGELGYIWSDHIDFSTRPNHSKVQRCLLCKSFFWDDYKDDRESFQFYVEALKYFERKYVLTNIFGFVNKFIYGREKKLLNKENLIYVRTYILRSYNVQIREYQVNSISNVDAPKKTKSEKDKILFVDNAKKLIHLLKQIDSKDLFLLAELYRNIGDFEEASRILNQLPDSYKKELLLKEIEKRNSDVIIINEITVPIPTKKNKLI